MAKNSFAEVDGGWLKYGWEFAWSRNKLVLTKRF